MTDHKPLITLYLDTRREKKNKDEKSEEKIYPIRLRVYHNKTTRYYSIGKDLTEDAFKRSYLAERPRQEYKQLKLELSASLVRASDIADELDPFTFEKFDKHMFRSKGDGKNVFYYYGEYIAKLEGEDRVGTARSYGNALQSLKTFVGRNGQKNTETLPFESVTPEFLQQYENWMLGKDKQKTTVGIYLRPLRALFNQAIEDGEITRDLYPFGKRKYVIPAGRNIKKALNMADLGTLFNYSLQEGCVQEKARDFWFFSYQMNGMNVQDIVSLKYKDIDGDRIVFTRTKTKNTSKGNSRPIIAVILPFAAAVIEKYGNKPKQADSYVFPVLSPEMDAKERKRGTQNFTRFINQHMRTVAEDAKISGDISTYWARHSFATNFIRAGGSQLSLQENMGHQLFSTTTNYIGSFEDDTKKEMAEKLMAF